MVTDNSTTRPMDNSQIVYNYRIQNDPKYAGYVNSKIRLENEDLPLREASFDVLPVVVSKAAKLLPSSNRISVYHGTSPVAKDQILETGLAARYSGEPGTLTAKALEGTEAAEASKNAVYTTTSKWDAARYAASHTANGSRVDNTASIPEQLAKLGRQVKAYVTSDGIVEASLPMAYKASEIWNPEFRAIVNSGTADALPSKYVGLANNSESARLTYGNVAFGNDRVFRADIPTKYIVGSKDYIDDAGLAWLANKSPSKGIYDNSVTAKAVEFNKRIVDSTPKRVGVHATIGTANTE